MSASQNDSTPSTHGGVLGRHICRLGVESFNPILFVGIRDGVGGPLLVLTAVALYCLRGGAAPVPACGDLPRFAAAGFCLYCSQAFFIVGEKLSSAMIGSACKQQPPFASSFASRRCCACAGQPSQPIFTTLIAVSLGWEPLTANKSLGILAAFAGAAFMVFFKQDSGGGHAGSGSGADDDTRSAASLIIGNSMVRC